MPDRRCPHCHTDVPTQLMWRSLFAGQTAHSCPHCNKRFRLTYAAKTRVAYMNVLLILGLVIVLAILWWKPDEVLPYAAIYAGVAALILIILPFLGRYEKTSQPYR